MALTSGRLVKTNGTPSGGQQPLQDALPFGWAYIHDTLTTGTPISITGGAGYTTLTNNASGTRNTFAYLPDGVTSSVWVNATSSFDFSQLAAGDMVEIRADVTVTTSAANQEVDFRLFLAIGGSDPTDIPLIPTYHFKTAGAYKLAGFASFPIPSADIRTNPARIRIQSVSNVTVVVTGFYLRIVRRG